MIGEASAKLLFRLAKKASIPFSMAIGNVELMHECFPTHSGMRTARMMEDKETDEDGERLEYPKM